MIALLCPGQGAQYDGLLRDIDATPIGRRTIAAASEHLGRDLREDDARLMQSTAAAQLALLVAGVASARMLAHTGTTIDAAAGHSVGAFAAAVACGALAFEDALDAVVVRGAGMTRVSGTAYGMAAFIGISEAEAAELAADATHGSDAVYPANVNAPDQIVLSGFAGALARAVAAAAARGVRVEPLGVQIPAHTVLLAEVAAELADAFARIEMRRPQQLYVTTAQARVTRDPALIRADLIASVARPVRWADAAQALYERGTRLFIEALPGTTLSDLAARAFPDARAVAMATSSSEAVAILARRLPRARE